MIPLLQESGKERMIGVVRLIADSENNYAEFAIVLGDPWQRQGLGTKMTDYMLSIAKERGIHVVYAHVLKENAGMIKIFRKRKFAIKDNGDHYYVSKIITA